MVTVCRIPVARWLANQVSDVLTSGSLTSDLFAKCSSNPSPRLTPAQDHLVGVVCHLPDLLANRLGHSLPTSLMPAAYFRLISQSLCKCLEEVHVSIKGEEGVLFSSAWLCKVNHYRILQWCCVGCHETTVENVKLQSDWLMHAKICQTEATLVLFGSERVCMYELH